PGSVAHLGSTSTGIDGALATADCTAYKLYMPTGSSGIPLPKLVPESNPHSNGQSQFVAFAMPQPHSGAAAALSLDSLGYRLQPVLLGSLSGGGVTAGGHEAATRLRIELAAAAAAAATAGLTKPGLGMRGAVDPGGGDASRGSIAATASTFNAHNSGGRSGAAGGGVPSPAARAATMGLNSATVTDGELTDESAATDRPAAVRSVPLSAARDPATAAATAAGEGAPCFPGGDSAGHGGDANAAAAATRSASGGGGYPCGTRNRASMAPHADPTEAQDVAAIDNVAAGAPRRGGGGGGSSLTSEFAALTQLANVDVQEALQLFFHQKRRPLQHR
ncbi:hypothetical protein Vretifemale_11226, partial [Volvox reticuliferus]